MEIRFTRAARKHRISRADAIHALSTCTKLLSGTPRPNGEPVYVAIGVDTRGRALEVGIVIEDDVVTIIHAMRARTKWS